MRVPWGDHTPRNPNHRRNPYLRAQTQRQEQQLAGQQQDATPSLARKMRPFSQSLSQSLSLFLSLCLFLCLLNQCNKLPCILSPFIHRRFSQPGSQQTPLSSWKRLPLCSETPGPLCVAPSTFTRQINNALRAAPAQLQRRRPSQWGRRIPSQSSPRPQNKTQRAFDTSPSCEK